MSEHYLDPKAFTQMFADPQANRYAIANGLAAIATGVARKFIFESLDDRTDAIADATLHGIERINRFRYGRNTSAFSYYSSVMFNRLRRYCVRLQSDRLRKAASLRPHHHPAV